jgi:uncharacterized RDD family membrane protein YckC
MNEPTIAAATLNDRRLEVDTPEQVAVGFDLAGPGSRFAAFLFDAVALVSIILAVLFGTFLIAAATNTAWRGSGSVFVALMVLLNFSVFYGYFVYFEGFRDGQTPGKKRFGLRVVHDGGYPITARAAAIRNLIRLVDVQPFPSSLIGGAFILFHPKAQRLGGSPWMSSVEGVAPWDRACPLCGAGMNARSWLTHAGASNRRPSRPRAQTRARCQSRRCSLGRALVRIEGQFRDDGEVFCR